MAANIVWATWLTEWNSGSGTTGRGLPYKSEKNVSFNHCCINWDTTTAILEYLIPLYVHIRIMQESSVG